MEYKINSCNYDIKEFIKKIINEYSIDYWDEWLKEQDYGILMIKPNILVCVEESNKLIGICAVKELNKDVCIMNTFYVDKDYRKKGIGSKLFDMCEEYAKKYKRINLCVDPNFKEAIKFYENRGYIFDYSDLDRNEIYYYKEVL